MKGKGKVRREKAREMEGGGQEMEGKRKAKQSRGGGDDGRR